GYVMFSHFLVLAVLGLLCLAADGWAALVVLIWLIAAESHANAVMLLMSMVECDSFCLGFGLDFADILASIYLVLSCLSPAVLLCEMCERLMCGFCETCARLMRGFPRLFWMGSSGHGCWYAMGLSETCIT
ncbi:hypothetical protein U1Q18_017537, partial [Sarracenia purpurea var. burkii]